MTRIITVGDSLTLGKWPQKLESKINKTEHYEVIDYARSAQCVLKKQPCTYSDSAEFQMALNSKPDIVTIMLGTNDAFEDMWDER